MSLEEINSHIWCFVYIFVIMTLELGHMELFEQFDSVLWSQWRKDK